MDFSRFKNPKLDSHENALQDTKDLEIAAAAAANRSTSS
jgi:hypothetical protein